MNMHSMLSAVLLVVMIFPVVILGLRWAGARLPKEAVGRRIFRGIGLGLVTCLSINPFTCPLALLILLYYGLKRGAQAIKLGQGGKRFAIGGAIMLFTLFALANLGSTCNRN